MLASSSLAQALWLAPPPGPAPTVAAPNAAYYDAAPAASPYRAQNDARGFYSEGSAFYGFGVSDAIEDWPELGSLDMVGAEFTIGHRFNKYQAVNLRISYGYGAGSTFIHDPSYGSHDIDMWQHTFTLMPGYRQSFRAGNSPIEFFFGVNAGLAVVGSYIDYAYRDPGYGWGYSEYDGAEAGFAYSAEVGVKYHYTPWAYLFVAYEFRGSTAAPDIEETYYGRSYFESNAQMYHTVRIGGGMQF